MQRCVVCRTTVEQDDIVVGAKNGNCVCVRCYHRETNSTAVMSNALRKQLVETLNGVV